jgi:colanic acid biosynthesis glycosyl transferase WcaI
LRVLLLNQCFYPDVAATGQYLTDLAVELVKRGDSVTVIASDRGYDDPSKRFSRRETWRGIEIIRIRSLTPVKGKRWRRALNFGSFLISCALRLALLPKFDAVVALTSPPLISFLASLFVQLRGGKLFFWVMDLNPDEAIVAGWLKESSLVARLLEFFLRYSLRRAERVIVLDRFMKQRLLARNIVEQKLIVIPPWVLGDAVAYDQSGREAFRERHNLSEKYVVMYAGNHSPCHPLETVLEAAQRLSDREGIAFCFVGGGSEQEKVRRFTVNHQLNNILCLPYQPLNELSGSLSAADLHLVVMGDGFTGIVHPCKIYNVLAVGVPVLYVGPDESHITDIARHEAMTNAIRITHHGDAESVANQIIEASSQDGDTRPEHTQVLTSKFSREVLVPAMLNVLSSGAPNASVTSGTLSQPLT